MMNRIKATEEMLKAAKLLVPSQEEILKKGYVESGDFMCMGTDEREALGQYWYAFVNTIFNDKKIHCSQTVLPENSVEGNTEVIIYKESPNLYVHRAFVSDGTLENWQETKECSDPKEFRSRLEIIPEDKLYIVFTLQDFFNQGTWGWYWNQRCLRFIGICKINHELSLKRTTVVWDVVKDKYILAKCKA